MQLEILEILKNFAKETGFHSSNEQALIMYIQLLSGFIINENYNLNKYTYLELDDMFYKKEEMINKTSK